MKVLIIHNPGSGNGNHSREDIEHFISQGEFSAVKYASMDSENWERIEKYKPDLIFLAGGDGSVHKLATRLLQGDQTSQIPVHILPLGTANNIAKTLQVVRPYDLHSFNTAKELQQFDIGRVKGLKGQEVFLEGVGAGIFPKLIAEMLAENEEGVSADKEIKDTLEKLLRIVKEFKAQRATIKTAGIAISGSFLLVEVMNIRYIGPNFELATRADPGDGYFDLVLIPEGKRGELIDYLEKMLVKNTTENDLKSLAFSMRVREAEIQWENSMVHVDDDLIPGFTGGSFTVSLVPHRLRFVKNP